MKRFVNRTGTLIVLIASCIGSATHTRAQHPALTLTNPRPGSVIGDPGSFGQKLAVVGDSWLIGDPEDSTAARYSGAVYLYTSNAVLRRTFINPKPANGYGFGSSMTAVGNDKLLIGAPFGEFPPAPNPGAAYLFHTNGTLIRTFLRPASQAAPGFGSSVAALGADRVAIGAARDDRAGTDSGAVYLFRTNGTLLATITNPAPVDSEYFGSGLTVLGTDRLLVGTAASILTPGSAYLFNTNGTLLAKFNHPIPVSVGAFGLTAAALGTDLVAISAPYANINAPRAGEVFLFRTNGVLFGPALGNPEATEDDNFGRAMAAVGPDKLLVGSFNQARAQNIGAAYLFSTNGTLLMTIRPPSTNEGQSFGNAMVAISTDRVLIGSPGSGAVPGGAAYVYDLRPSLSVSKTAAGTALLSWPSPWNGWAVQQNTDLNTTNWESPPEAVNNDGTSQFIIVNPSAGNRSYRLFKP